MAILTYRISRGLISGIRRRRNLVTQQIGLSTIANAVGGKSTTSTATTGIVPLTAASISLANSKASTAGVPLSLGAVGRSSILKYRINRGIMLVRQRTKYPEFGTNLQLRVSAIASGASSSSLVGTLPLLAKSAGSTSSPLNILSTIAGQYGGLGKSAIMCYRINRGITLKRQRASYPFQYQYQGFTSSPKYYKPRRLPLIRPHNLIVGVAGVSLFSNSNPRSYARNRLVGVAALKASANTQALGLTSIAGTTKLKALSSSKASSTSALTSAMKLMVSVVAQATARTILPLKTSLSATAKAIGTSNSSIGLIISLFSRSKSIGTSNNSISGAVPITASGRGVAFAKASIGGAAGLVSIAAAGSARAFGRALLSPIAGLLASGLGIATSTSTTKGTVPITAASRASGTSKSTIIGVGSIVARGTAAALGRLTGLIGTVPLIASGQANTARSHVTPGGIAAIFAAGRATASDSVNKLATVTSQLALFVRSSAVGMVRTTTKVTTVLHTNSRAVGTSFSTFSAVSNSLALFASGTAFAASRVASSGKTILTASGSAFSSSIVAIRTMVSKVGFGRPVKGTGGPIDTSGDTD